MKSFGELMQDKSTWIDKATILRVEVGSTLHGIAAEDVANDTDHMGVCLEPFDVAWSTEGEFEQHVYRTAAEREKRHDAPSRPGDLDLTIYSLRKWCRLALKGNPSVLLMLFAPTDKVVTMNAHGSRLRDLAPEFASKQALGAFLGYLQAQRQRIAGDRGGMDVNRRELTEKFGFDTKYAAHMLRLGYQGIEYAETGRLTLPMREPIRAELVGVRRGEMSLDAVLTLAGRLESELRDLRITSPLPEHPNYAVVNVWLRDTYMSWWHAQWSDSKWRDR